MTNQFSSIQEQARKQRARYKRYYILTKCLLFAGMLAPRFLFSQPSVKSLSLIPLLIFGLVFLIQVVLLSESFGQKSPRPIAGVVVSDGLYAIHLLVHLIMAWMNFAFVRFNSLQGQLLLTQLVLPVAVFLLGLLSLALSWLWWRSYRKSQAYRDAEEAA